MNQLKVRTITVPNLKVYEFTGVLGDVFLY